MVWIWVTLGRPKTTLVLGLALLGLILLRWFIPQQLALNVTPAEWSTNLPAPIQSWGQLLYALGLSRIMHSAWFWLPVALLLLNSLIALAEFGPPGWRRATAAFADYGWQHPLAHRVEHSIRLPASPDDLLETLKLRLTAAGFQLDVPVDDNARLVSAKRYRWLWLAVITFYAGVLLLCAAFFISFFTFETEQLTLQPFKLKQSRLFQGELQIYKDEAYQNQTIVIVYPTAESQEARALFLNLYQPFFFRRLIIWPVASEPVLTVEAVDMTGLPRRLLPEQIDLSPDTRLNLSLVDIDQPHYFRIPSESLAFQILSVPEEGEGHFNIQVRRGSESSPSDNFLTRIGESFEVDGLTVTLTLNQSLEFIVLRDPALPLYVLCLMLMVGSGLLLLFFSPAQCWLIPEVKGRGGQLYGVQELLGRNKSASTFLETLLEVAPEEDTAAASVAESQNEVL